MSTEVQFSYFHTANSAPTPIENPGYANVAGGVCVADPTERTSGAIESIAIMFAVVLIVLVTALINWSKDLQFRGLQQQLDKQLKCLVVRRGDMRQVPSTDVVVGDICIIQYGNAP